MALTGILRSWDEARGFGFIAPRDGGRELFVHVSAFPRDGSRPTIGETVVYELGVGRDGRPQAVRVHRQAIGQPSARPVPAGRRTPPHRSAVIPVIGLLVAAMVGVAAFLHVSQRAERSARSPAASPVVTKAVFRCDGRTHCSQMTSCAEATHFLRHCPGTQMDGDGDGVPCEQQWCTGPFAR